jgi:hypothetical protein
MRGIVSIRPWAQSSAGNEKQSQVTVQVYTKKPRAREFSPEVLI